MIGRGLIIILAAGVGLAGCTSQDRDLSSLGGKQGSSLNSDRSHFDSEKDPPINADTRVAAGQLAESQGNLQGALQQYKEALRLDPNNQGALFRLGSLYTQLKMFGDAVETWQRYIKATGGSAASYNNLAYCHELAGRSADAEAAYKLAVARDPSDQASRVNYGLMLARLGRVTDATIQLQAALKPGEVHYNLGSIFEQQGKIDQARAEYEKAIMLDPSLRDAKARLAAIK
jgi:tetratricopeptide (TPR) repeat protein